MLRSILRTVVMACFAFWFGGFGFYVSVVVPIGNEILGSTRDQGVITQQVTDWLNIFSAIAVAAMILESVLSWNSKSGPSRWLLLSFTAIVAGTLGGLVGLHQILDAMFDPSELAISDEVEFYEMHRIYLWLSTVQWFAAWGWLFTVIFRWSRPTAVDDNRPASV